MNTDHTDLVSQEARVGCGNSYLMILYECTVTLREVVMATKVTGAKVASKASGVLRSPSTGGASKTAAGSSLSQVSPPKTTSAKAASAASRVMRDGRTSAAAKSAAGSALAQAKKR